MSKNEKILVQVRADANGIVDKAGNEWTDEAWFLEWPNGIFAVEENSPFGKYALNTEETGASTESLSEERLKASEDWTISLWSYKKECGSLYDNVIDFNYESSGERYILRNYFGAARNYIGLFNSSYEPILKSKEAQTLGKWTHIAIVNHNAELKMYVDGMLQSTAEAVEIEFGYTAIGSETGGGRDKPGLIDDLVIVKEAIWTEEFEPPKYYLFEEAIQEAKYRFKGNEANITFYPEKSHAENLALCKEGQTYYAGLVTLDKRNASTLKIRHNGKTYAVAEFNQIKVEKPTISDKIYSGSEQSVELIGFDEELMKLSGTTKATEVGSYDVRIDLKDERRYSWPDGNTAGLRLKWKIEQAEPWTISTETVVFSLDKFEEEIEVEGLAEASNFPIYFDAETFEVEKEVEEGQVKRIKIKPTYNSTSETTIDIITVETKNYKAMDKTITVRFDLPETLEEASWEQIQAATQYRVAPKLWAAGDRKSVKINGSTSPSTGVRAINGTYYAMILGFDHNVELESEGKPSTHFVIGQHANGTDIAFVEADWYGYGSQNPQQVSGGNYYIFRHKLYGSATNAGGYKSSLLRTKILTELYKYLPAELKKVIVACNKYTDNTGGTSGAEANITATSDNLWLMSPFELHGTLLNDDGDKYQANIYEPNYQKQYEYYAKGAEKIRYKHNATGTACYWWLRSPYCGNTTNYARVHTTGGWSTSSANTSWGLVPCFMVA